MNVIVVYESRYGNTARVAHEIAAALEASGPVRLIEISDATAFDVKDTDLLVVGGPTEGHGMSPTLRARLMAVPPDALRGVALAPFDTRLKLPAFLAGSAARGIAKILQAKGARLVVPPESFLVTGTKEEVHLVEGEIERAGAWAEKVRAEAASRLVAAEGRQQS
jgi:flavodoxin